MKIGLYFGSFNPIHIGHLIIAEFINNNTDVQQIWFVVSPHNPFKQASSLLNSYHRLYLVQKAIEENLHLRASDVEFKLPTPSYTIDTLTYLQEKYPNHEFAVVLGSDSFQNIKKWKNAEVLMRDYTFLVYKRPGFAIPDFPEATYIVLDNAPILEISSTYIREQLKKKNSVRYLLSETVYKEIIENRYYQ